MLTDRFTADKATLRKELKRCARARQNITYGDAAALVGRSTAGLAPLLTSIRVEEAMHRRPDLGALVVTVGTGLPSYVKAEPADQARAIAVQEEVWQAWADGEWAPRQS